MSWIFAALSLLKSKIGRYVAAAGVMALTVGIVLLKAFNAGKASERAKQQRATLKAYKERQHVEEDTSRLDPDDIRRRLSDDWPE